MFNDQSSYHSTNGSSQFDALSITKLDGLMSSNELICQNANKLAAQGMLDELRSELSAMDQLIARMPASWPEFCIHLARIRGYAFLGFRIYSALADNARPKHPPQIPKKSIDDFL